MALLPGLHDIESSAIAPPDTWLLDTVAISDNPVPKNYPANLNVITRINWAYGSGGTLPLPSVYEAFARMVAVHVNSTRNCKRWVIGNESNLAREWPDNTPIYPWHYAACYKLCRQAIHALPGHEQDEVLIAASGPWNAELKYTGNPTGDWITYFADVIDLCGGEIDGFSLHAYTHQYDVNLVTSTAKMDAPFQNRFYEFRTYQDYIRAIPEAFWHLPIYITEANGNGPWKAVGLMPAMLDEINGWNEMVRDGRLPAIRSVIFYRYPRYDQFFIEGRDDVINEYRSAVSLGYRSPITPSLPIEPPEPAPGPEPEPPAPAPGPLPGRDIDPALIARGVEFDFVTPPAGAWYWAVVAAQHLNEQEADEVGPDHHILGTIVRDGTDMADVPLKVSWPSGSTTIHSKAEQPFAAYNYDYPMSSSLNEFSIWVNDGAPTDKVSGIGMGAGGNPSIHTSTWIDWQWVQMPEIVWPPEPEPPTPTPIRDRLIWPVVGPVTQFFGSHGITYAGAPGHDGIDFAVVTGTPVKAVADGIVKWVGFDRDGFGQYIRIFHPGHGFHSFMGHLSQVIVAVGQTVKQGQTVALSGSTGNSTGPHLHFSTRIGEEDDYYELHDGYSNGAANPLAVYGLINRVDPNSTLMSRG